MARILVVDDEQDILKSFSELLSDRDLKVDTAVSGEEALAKFENESYDVVLTDLRMPGISGMGLLEQIKAQRSEVKIIFITAFGAVDTAVEAMKKGAFHYICKPVNLDEVQILVQRALQESQMERELAQLRREVHQKFEFSNIIGKSKVMQEVFDLIRQVAPSKSTVLIQGKSGTGKELVAKAIHYNSPRRNSPFVAINCSAITETLLESELFGHVKGAFTGAIANKKGIFEEADGGTVFLDEIADTSPAMQVKVLRVLQEREIRRVGGNENIQVDVRLIASSNQNLEEAVREGRFREDIYYRLNVIPIHLPPLKDRPEDIPLLAQHFLARHASEAGANVTGISKEAMRMLLRYTWPGNVRELGIVIERAVILGAEGEIKVEDLGKTPWEDHRETLGEVIPLKSFTEKMERAHIARVLEQTGGQVSEAARILGLSRGTLYRKMEAYRIRKD